MFFVTDSTEIFFENKFIRIGHINFINFIILNIGICGASKKFEISELIKIDFEKNILTCVDKPISSPNNYNAVDMESTGFIDATSLIKNRYMFKVVSDHFEPHMVTKDKTKKLIYDKIDEIMESLI